MTDYLIYFLYFYTTLNAILAGIYFVVPFKSAARFHLYANMFFLGVLFSPVGYILARYMNIGFLENVYGNKVDGYDGDDNYKNKEAKVWFRKPWSGFWWSVIRNPVNNMLRNIINAKGTIANIKHEGNVTLVTMTDGKEYFFFYNKGDKYLVKLGWRFWSDQIKLGKEYDASFVLNP